MPDSCQAIAGDLQSCVREVLPAAAAAEVLRRLEASKLESLAEFAAGAGHEINNPLGVISGRAAMLLRGETDPERRRMLATIGAQALRIRDMIGDVMVFARPPQPRPEALNLAEVARGVAAQFADAVPPEVSLSISGDDPVPVWADRVQLCVVIEALVRNGVEALDGVSGESTSARIEIETHAPDEQRGPGPAAAVPVPMSRLVVCDTGRGLSEQDREHLFDPFYSGRAAGRGLGFGLCKCWRIVTQHGGRIEVESPEDGPTTFRVLWPAAAATAERA
ncbi:MAG TPA: HAMP domain-containing sensor histidine kinase [Planctomycetaceae bacterium]|nr:HAMP domain-containing sensor histidine kinase [Planctomycetaceae bacterium]